MNKHFIFCGIFMAISFFGFSQTPTEVKEADFDNIKIKTDKPQLKKDKEELINFQNKLEEFNEAYENKDYEKVNILKNDLLYEMKREVAQSEAKIKLDKKEYKMSKKEYKLSKKREKISKEDYKISEDDDSDKEAYKKDKKATDNDKRKAKDDKRDLKEQKKRFDEQEKIIKKLEDYTFYFTSDFEKDNRKHRKLITDFHKTMIEDLATTESELKEN